MLTTIGGNTREASSGAVMVSPSFTLSWTLATALAMMTFPAVSLTMVSACKMGTPLLTSVPSVRVKREMETLVTTWPVGGITSLVLSQMRRPNLVLMKSKNITTTTAIAPIVPRMLLRMMSLTANTNTVNPGSVMPMPPNTSLNLGTTNVISKIMMPMATINTAVG